MVPHVNAQHSAAFAGDGLLNFLQVIRLTAARGAPLPPRIKHHDLAFIVVKADCLLRIHERFTTEVLHWLAFILRVGDFGLSTRSVERESPAHRHSILSSSVIFAAGGEQQTGRRQGCDHGVTHVVSPARARCSKCL